MFAMSLVVAIATLGASTDDRVKIGWDRTLHDELIYNIEIDRTLGVPMREGQAISGHMVDSVKNLKYFRISVKPTSSTLLPESPLKKEGVAHTEKYVDHGWRPMEDSGEMEYLIQIRPQRLEQLLKGQPIEGEIHPDAGDVRHLYIFVGDKPLERDDGSTLQPIGGRYDSETTAYGDRQSGSTRSGIGSGRTSSGTLSRNGSGIGMRRDTDSNFDDAPVFNSSRGSGTLNAPEPRRTASGFNDGSLSDTRLADRRLSTYQTGAGSFNDFGGSTNQALRQDTSIGPLNSASNLSTQDQRALLQMELQVTKAEEARKLAEEQAKKLGEELRVAKQDLADATRRPILLLTALGLAVSLGFNAYFAWLAWTFFWRYREGSSELARARTDALHTRQFA